MTIDRLPLSKKKLLARQIRRFLEPDGANLLTSAHTLISESKVKELIVCEEFSTTDLEIEGLGDILKILHSNYNQKTTDRLIKHIKPSVVWDCSICSLNTDFIKELFYSNESTTNLITSLTFNELLNLVQKEPTSNNGLSIYNAQFLSEAILADTDSKFSTSVILKKTDYVDNQILDFCSRHNYSLYTCDQPMGLRAKSRHIDVTTFSNEDCKTLDYTPHPNGTPIILHADLIGTVSVDDIVNQAQQQHASKFIISNQFVEALEKCRDRDIIHFLIADNKNDYTYYLNEEESNKHICELSKTYNATIFSSNTSNCFYYKTIHCKYQLVIASEFKDFFDHINDFFNTTTALKKSSEEEKSSSTEKVDIVTKLDKSATSVIGNVTESDINKISKKSNEMVTLPHYASQINAISFRKLLPNEKIWILDSDNNEVISPNTKRVVISADFTVIYGKNNLNGSYNIAVYKVKEHNNNLRGVIEKEIEFKRNSIDKKVEHSLKSYASKLILLT